MNTHNDQSYFKLPLIVTICSWGILTLIRTFSFFINLDNFDYFDFFVTLIIYNSTFESLSSYSIIFILTLYCCQKYCIHDVYKNWKRIILLSFVFSLLKWASWRFVYDINNQIRIILGENLYLNYFSNFCLDILINIVILFTLFYFFSRINIFYRSIYDLDTTAYIKLFALILSYIPLQILLINDELFTQLFRSYFLITLIFLAILFLLWPVLYKLFNIIIKNSLEHDDSIIKLGKLILTLIIICFSSAVTSSAIICIFLIVYFSSDYLSFTDIIVDYKTNILLVYFWINLILSFLLSYFFIKVFYKKDN